MGGCVGKTGAKNHTPKNGDLTLKKPEPNPSKDNRREF